MLVISQGVDMTAHPQYITVRNGKGQELLSTVRHRLEIEPTVSSGSRQQFVMSTVVADDAGKFGKGKDPLPRWLGTILAWVLDKLGPKGLEFARYSIDYHYIRNYLHVKRAWTDERGEEHIPAFVKKIVSMYDGDGAVSKQLEKH